MFDLARDMGMLVEDMMERLSDNELSYWIAYHRIKRRESKRKG